MNSNQRRKNRRQQQPTKELIMLEQTVKEVQESLANGSATKPVVEVPALTTPALVECSIQYDVKAPDMARWRNAGWQVVHYQFVNNDRDLPVLAVVMERPATATTDPLQDESAIKPEAPAPLNFDATQKVEVVFDDIQIADEPEPFNEPELVPSMDTTGITIEQPEASSRGDKLLKKLAEGKPYFSAILEHGADAVLSALDAQVMDVAQAAYEAALPPENKHWRFESKLLSSGNNDDMTGAANPGEVTIEAELKEVVLS